MEKKKITLQTTLKGKTFEEWDFKRADTQYLTHGLHRYPARMIPPLAKRLINRYSNFGDVILDPFCGSGSVLVEARLNRRNGVGIDSNNFACLLTKVKTTPFRPYFSEFSRAIGDAVRLRNRGKIKIPPIPNVSHWFKKHVAEDLTTISQAIDKIKNAESRDLAKVCFSKTVFESSNINHNSSYYIRILPKERLKQHNPRTFEIFRSSLLEAIIRVNQFEKECRKAKDVWTQVVVGDSRKIALNDTSIDLVVSSPPYGEEKNTIDYVRWSKFAMYWLGYNMDEIKKMHKRALGGGEPSNFADIPSETARDIISKVGSEDEQRAGNALLFFKDYYKSLSEIYRVLKDGAFCCLVIGNRSIRGNRIDMGRVTVDITKDIGFSHLKTHYRKLPYKAIPVKSGDVKTMTRENIVILKK